MTYRIAGLDPAQFSPLWAMDPAELGRHRAARVTADADFGFPCRVTLEDAQPGEQLMLLHHVHHDVELVTQREIDRLQDLGTAHGNEIDALLRKKNDLGLHIEQLT